MRLPDNSRADLPSGVPDTGTPSTPGKRTRTDGASQRRTAGVGEPVPEGLRAKLEGAYRVNLGDVRVHVDDEAQDRGAVAFAAGNEIHIGPEVALDSPPGEAILAHEIGHLVQQRGGNAAGDDSALEAPDLERETNHAAGLALAGKPATIRGQASSRRSRSSARASSRHLSARPPRRVVA
jgi:hypothetical protein